jgi:hypothetical protein
VAQQIRAAAGQAITCNPLTLLALLPRPLISLLNALFSWATSALAVALADTWPCAFDADVAVVGVVVAVVVAPPAAVVAPAALVALAAPEPLTVTAPAVRADMSSENRLLEPLPAALALLALLPAALALLLPAALAAAFDCAVVCAFSVASWLAHKVVLLIIYLSLLSKKIVSSDCRAAIGCRQLPAAGPVLGPRCTLTGVDRITVWHPAVRLTGHRAPLRASACIDMRNQCQPAPRRA